MAKTTSSKKAKGTRLEKEIAERIEEVLGDYNVKATRTPMSGAIDRFKSDIFTNLPISFEAKNQERWRIPSWWKQCEGDASSGRMPILAISKNRSPTYVFFEFEDFLILLDYAIQAGWADGSPKPVSGQTIEPPVL